MCEKGQIPYNNKCYSPSDFQKVLTAATGVATNQGGTKSSTPSVPTDKKDDKKSAFDWVAVLSILAGAAPAVIAATKGQSPNPAYSGEGSPNYGNNGGTPPKEEDSSSIPIWVWGVVGVVIAVVVYLIFKTKK